MKISVCIPVYDGKLPFQLALALLTETTIATAVGDSLSVRFLPSCTNLALGRNQLVKEFMASDCERLVFVDADVTFEPGAIVRIAHHPGEIVGGAYRLKQDKEDYPVGWLPGEKTPDKNGLIEVAMLATGFLAHSRSAFERFQAAYPDRDYEIQGHKNYCWFQIPYARRHLFDEAGYFCMEWKAIGGKIHLDPSLTLTHWAGNIPYKGNIGSWLKSQTEGAA